MACKIPQINDKLHSTTCSVYFKKGDILFHKIQTVNLLHTFMLSLLGTQKLVGILMYSLTA